MTVFLSVLGWLGWVVLILVEIILWLFGALLFCLWWSQGNLLYIPTSEDRHGIKRHTCNNPQGYRHPGEAGMPYEEAYLPTEDGMMLHVWFIPQKLKRSVKCPTLLWLHGNAGNIGFRIPNAKCLYEKTGCNILMLEYRGYGSSSGDDSVLSEKGLMIDAETALNWLRRRDDVDKDNIFLFGRSLGGAVAIACAYYHMDKIRGILLENTFLSVDKMVDVLAKKLGLSDRFSPLLAAFLYFFLTSHWKSERKIGTLCNRLMFISGDKDELIPPSHMRWLYDESKTSVGRTWLSISNGTHNDTHLVAPIQYYNAIAAFLWTKHGVSECVDTNIIESAFEPCKCQCQCNPVNVDSCLCQCSCI